MKLDRYMDLPADKFGGQPCRVVQSNNKTIVLLEWGTVTPFEQACLALTRLGETNNDIATTTPRVLSVDAMSIGYHKAKAADRYGCVLASANHEVIVYTDRGEDLNFLMGKIDNLQPTIPLATMTSSIIKSNAEHLQERLHQEKTKKRESIKEKQKDTTSTYFKSLINSLKKAIHKPGNTETDAKGAAMERFLRDTPSTSRQTLMTPAKTRANIGQVSPPNYRQVEELDDHKRNAFVEYQALTRAVRDVKLLKCKNIMRPYQQDNQKLLGVRLDEANAAIYNNDSCTIVAGKMSGHYMAAYNATNGFVIIDEDELRRTGKTKFILPPGDPIVVVADCTRIMLEERILQMADAIAGDLASGLGLVDWAKPASPGMGEDNLGGGKL